MALWNKWKKFYNGHPVCGRKIVSSNTLLYFVIKKF